MTERSEELVLPADCVQGDNASRNNCISKWLSIPLQGVSATDLLCILDSLQQKGIIEDCYDVGFSLGMQIYGMQDSRLDGEDPNDALRFTLQLCLHACRDSCYHGAIQEWLKKRIGQTDPKPQRIGGEIFQEMAEDMDIFQQPLVWQSAVIGGMGRALHSLHPEIASEACTYFDTSPTMCAEGASYSHGDIDPEWHELSTCDNSEISFDNNVIHYYPLEEEDIGGDSIWSFTDHGNFCVQVIFDPSVCASMEMELSGGGYNEERCEYAGECIDAIAQGVSNLQNSYSAFCDSGSDGVTFTALCPDRLGPAGDHIHATHSAFTSTTSTEQVIEIHEKHSISRHLISTLGATAFMIFSIVFLIRLSRINPKDVESSQNGFTRIEEFDLNIQSDEEGSAGVREMTAI